MDINDADNIYVALCVVNHTYAVAHECAESWDDAQAIIRQWIDSDMLEDAIGPYGNDCVDFIVRVVTP